MTTYNSAKVWTADPTPQVKSSPSRSRSPVGLQGRSRRTGDPRDLAERNVKLGVWGRLGAVAILSAAMLWWPYGRSCGIGLATYLAASMMIIVGGLWVVACTWICRMARTHALAMLVALWGVGLIMTQVVPRVSYAGTNAPNPATWLCRGS